MASEQRISKEIILATTHLVDWMRNNSGVAIHRVGSFVKYGVGGPGGADYIGIERSSGRFVAMEVKGPSGRVSDEQQVFMSRVARSGGLAFVARSVEDAVNALQK